MSITRIAAFLRVFSIVAAAGLAAVRAAPEAREETLSLFEQRKVSVLVPAGFDLVSGRDSSGLLVVRLADAKDRCSLEVRFIPDPEGRYSQARARRELMHQMFAEYVGTSTEKGMQFEELAPRTGSGTYCVFTDSNLVGKSELPPGEYLHVTSGVKAWPGVVALFRCFSNETDSPEYQAVMQLLRESLYEKTVPLR